MPAPTSEDAHLYIQLMGLVQDHHFVEARAWVASDLDAGSFKDLDHKHPVGSDGRARLEQVLGFYESAGAMVSRGLLHEDLFFDAPLGLEHVWARVEPLVLDWQKTTGNESAWENLAWLARRYQSWRETTWRPKDEAIPTDRPPTKTWGETAGHVGFTKG